MMNFYSQSSSPLPFAAMKEQSLSQQQQKPFTFRRLDIQKLYDARDKLRQFAHEIGGLRYAGIRTDVIQHCDKLKINLNQNLSYERVEKMVKNRIEKMIKNKRIKKNWSQEDVLILIWIVSKYSDAKSLSYIERDLVQADWQEISQLIPGVSGQNCMFKWLSLKKNNLSENYWSQKQSSLLQKIIGICGEDDWPLVSQKLYYANHASSKIYRCPKQCRQHWNCYLNPKIKKGPWSKQEDELLLKSVKKNNGQKRWAQIVKYFNGRTENALKNRFTLIIEKQMKNHPNNNNISQLQLIEEYLQRTYVQQLVDIKIQEQALNQSNKKDKIKKQKLIRAQSSKAKQTPIKPIRTSLRKKDSIRSYNPKIFDEDSNQQQINIKIQEQNHQISEPTPIINKFQQHHFSSLYRDIKLQPHLPQENYSQISIKLDQKKKKNVQNKELLGNINDIKMVATNHEVFKNLFQNFGTTQVFPCILMDNKLMKFDS